MPNVLTVQDNVASHVREARTAISAAVALAIMQTYVVGTFEVVIAPGVSSEFYLNSPRFFAGDAPIGVWIA